MCTVKNKKREQRLDDSNRERGSKGEEESVDMCVKAVMEMKAIYEDRAKV